MTYKRTESVVTREIAGEKMLIPIAGKIVDMQKIFSLDDVSGLIWGMLDGVNSLEDIVAAVVDEYDVPSDKAVADASKFIDELNAAGLVEQA
jgi:hypothetical protein